MTSERRLLSLGAAIATVIVLAALSRVPYSPTPKADALLTLSWRARGEQTAVCRPVTDEERARTPAHMQRDEICDAGRILPYRLQVSIDDSMRIDELAGGSGRRGDRAIVVHHELAIRPGARHMIVLLERSPEGGSAPGASGTLPDTSERSSAVPSESQAGGRRTPRLETLPPVLLLDTVHVFGDREAAIITYDAGERRLLLLTGPTRPRRQAYHPER